MPTDPLNTSNRRQRSSGRISLTRDEIFQLDAALLRAFQTIRTLRDEMSAARYIKFPPLPSIFSESIVIAAVRRLFGPQWTARYGGAKCDVLIENGQGDTKRIEVKATGEHAFQEFKAKDLRADYLVWIRFGRRFQLGSGPIEIAILADPGRFILETCRLDTARLAKRIGDSETMRVVTFDSLAQLLAD